MSYYISNRQYNANIPIDKQYVSVLLECSETDLLHRVFPKEHELSHILADTFELTNNLDGNLYYPVLPGPCACMIFKFNSQAASSSFCGMSTSLKKILVPPKYTLFCVRFSPGTTGYLLKDNAKLLTNQSQPLDAYFPHASLLMHQIRSSESFHERNIRIHHYLRMHSLANYYAPVPVLKRCLDLIYARRGNIRIGDLAAEAGCSERYIGRIFHEHVGCSPKMYCEITRMQISLSDILMMQPKSLMHTATAYGYFDQPHMNRAYQKLLGRHHRASPGKNRSRT